MITIYQDVYVIYAVCQRKWDMAQEIPVWVHFLEVLPVVQFSLGLQAED